MSNMFEPGDFPPDEIIAEIYIHFIYWTRKLRQVLAPSVLADVRQRMDQALFKIDGEAIAAGGTGNHLHILARLSPEHSVQEAIDLFRQQCKGLSLEACGEPKCWSDNDVAVSINPGDLQTAKDFIENQSSHHEIVSFQSELKAIFDEHGFEYDPAKLWG